MTEYVCGLSMDPSNTILMVRKLKPEWQKGKLNAIGGKIEEGETPLEAMKREWIEETGLIADVGEWIPYAIVSGVDWKVHFFHNRAPFSYYDEWENHDDEWKNDIGETLVPVLYPDDLFQVDMINNLRYLIPLAFEGSLPQNRDNKIEVINAPIRYH